MVIQMETSCYLCLELHSLHLVFYFFITNKYYYYSPSGLSSCVTFTETTKKVAQYFFKSVGSESVGRPSVSRGGRGGGICTLGGAWFTPVTQSVARCE